MTIRNLHPSRLLPEERLITAGEAFIVFTPILPYNTNEPFLTPAERDRLSSFAHGNRRNEAAAWRGALRRLTGCGDTAYTPSGAPYIPDSSLHISVSHTTSLAAVMVAGKRCAIDIEKRDRNFGRVSGRYISLSEQAIPHGYDSLWPAVAWCAKEALYKISGQRGLDLLHDILITGIGEETGVLKGMTRNANGGWKEYEIHMATLENFLCAWITE